MNKQKVDEKTVECAIELGSIAMLVEMGRVPQSELEKVQRIFKAILEQLNVQEEQIAGVSAEDVLNYLCKKYKVEE